MTDPTTVLLADDHLTTLLGAELLINSHPGLQVVAKTRDPAECVHLAAKLQPKVAIIDLQFPGGLEFSLCARIKAASPKTAVGVHSGFTSGENIHETFKVGADGFLGKLDSDPQLPEFVARLASGESVLDAKLEASIQGLRRCDRREAMLSALTEWRAAMDREAARRRVESLSRRELEVLKCLASLNSRFKWGSLREKLGFKSEQQVYAYAAKIKARLGVQTMEEAIALLSKAAAMS